MFLVGKAKFDFFSPYHLYILGDLLFRQILRMYIFSSSLIVIVEI